MADPDGPSSGGEPGVPRWVKVIGVVVATLIALVVLAQVTGLAGDHGPGRHLGGLGAVAPGGSGPGGFLW
ncbi:hypothetical protein AB0M36_24845 [Actinoplanes sp. NPDC051346]|uniref:hypothetical protein n=1 Tax=Actinoplanes sp. NPDC051346 TaxID=3155048 RepID=UPI00341FD732